MCHSSSTDPKIKNSVGASKEPDSFLKLLSWCVNPLMVWLRVVLCLLMDRAKKQVEQVWVTPSYDMSDSGMCVGIIKHNSASRSSTWFSRTMGGKQKKSIKGTYTNFCISWVTDWSECVSSFPEISWKGLDFILPRNNSKNSHEM